MEMGWGGDATGHRNSLPGPARYNPEPWRAIGSVRWGRPSWLARGGSASLAVSVALAWLLRQAGWRGRKPAPHPCPELCLLSCHPLHWTAGVNSGPSPPTLGCAREGNGQDAFNLGRTRESAACLPWGSGGGAASCPTLPCQMDRHAVPFNPQSSDCLALWVGNLLPSLCLAAKWKETLMRTSSLLPACTERLAWCGGRAQP